MSNIVLQCNYFLIIIITIGISLYMLNKSELKLSIKSIRNLNEESKNYNLEKDIIKKSEIYNFINNIKIFDYSGKWENSINSHNFLSVNKGKSSVSFFLKKGAKLIDDNYKNYLLYTKIILKEGDYILH